mmetsp:Transcript_40948/g.118298  ORF Transcript_40948/g.118298 Transcript_40948/m.118298 type:complete len:203 (-) Transcript_40948:1578-2186(-)
MNKADVWIQTQSETYPGTASCGMASRMALPIIVTSRAKYWNSKIRTALTMEMASTRHSSEGAPPLPKARNLQRSRSPGRQQARSRRRQKVRARPGYAATRTAYSATKTRVHSRPTQRQVSSTDSASGSEETREFRMARMSVAWKKYRTLLPPAVMPYATSRHRRRQRGSGAATAAALPRARRARRRRKARWKPRTAPMKTMA